MLARAGARLTSYTSDRRTPADLARANGHPATAGLLAELIAARPGQADQPAAEAPSSTAWQDAAARVAASRLQPQAAPATPAPTAPPLSAPTVAMASAAAAATALPRLSPATPAATTASPADGSTSAALRSTPSAPAASSSLLRDMSPAGSAAGGTRLSTPARLSPRSRCDRATCCTLEGWGEPAQASVACLVRGPEPPCPTPLPSLPPVAWPATQYCCTCRRSWPCNRGPEAALQPAPAPPRRRCGPGSCSGASCSWSARWETAALERRAAGKGRRWAWRG